MHPVSFQTETPQTPQFHNLSLTSLSLSRSAPLISLLCFSLPLFISPCLFFSSCSSPEFGVHLAELTVDAQGALAIRQVRSAVCLFVCLSVFICSLSLYLSVL